MWAAAPPPLQPGAYGRDRCGTAWWPHDRSHLTTPPAEANPPAYESFRTGPEISECTATTTPPTSTPHHPASHSYATARLIWSRPSGPFWNSHPNRAAAIWPTRPRAPAHIPAHLPARRRRRLSPRLSPPSPVSASVLAVSVVVAVAATIRGKLHEDSQRPHEDGQSVDSDGRSEARTLHAGCEHSVVSDPAGINPEGIALQPVRLGLNTHASAASAISADGWGVTRAA